MLSEHAKAQLDVTVYAPPLVPGDERPPAMAHAIEETWPDERMVQELRQKPGKKYQYDEVVHGKDRDEWLRSKTEEGAIPWVSNGNNDRPITISGSANPETLASGGVAQLHVYGTLPSTPPFVERADAFLERLGRGLRAYWGTLTPDAAHLDIVQQIIHEDSDDKPPRGLPALLPPDDRLEGPHLPYFLGWVNYWSAETAARLGFPDARRDAEWLARARRADGGWIVRLTDEPLELDRADHLDALARAYARFAAVGRAPR